VIGDIEVRPAGRKGQGVFARRAFRKREFILRRRHGRVVPNAMRSGVKVFAWRAVRRGEEITIDYRLNACGGERTKCLCGARSCTGTLVNSFFALSPARQRAYLPYAPAFIRREHRRRSATV